MLEYKFFDCLNDDIRYIRETVFIKEQGFLVEYDDIDKYAKYLLVYYNDKAIATSRMYIENGDYHIGRIAVLKEYRHMKLGSLMMRILEDEIKRSGGKRIILSSQVRAKDFYQKCGYHPFGDIYLDEYCKHILMIKDI